MLNENNIYNQIEKKKSESTLPNSEPAVDFYFLTQLGFPVTEEMMSTNLVPLAH